MVLVEAKRHHVRGEGGGGGGGGGGQEGCKVIIHGVNPRKGTNFYGGGDLSRHYHGGSHYITPLF